ncbi:uncharacterized protein LOC126374407 [Pectinophora gossypiella]|uniref:uncharacterized protein LOC126374407 n=1 Tax=Pectinophora gossypiella TaxID=13191 RepID=UPI00214E4BE8|nr:uncharacterized protein LOC126374407 [Pectinophora gossypiella]XP_049877004.1 uncharacterized protein LOC126374407 [Pectinophora gossypiella]XP_049877005.1 uncharacterized protein LOC126374407 [Pectinophora gossypiella]XP_049877006.1 uncharacterized protein LOC126374407 [Pectinophora gossypiella]XP_049877007.1 uncharacterized protein LOC126374407 [Pectinophora gossypiella]XP_049877008.1 uncharacterized protein LOC126374407 [Pectinophora gossypiella]
MKVLAVFAAVVAVATAAYSPVATWTLEELSAAISNPDTDPAHVPYLAAGLNTIMAGLHAGSQQTSVVISMPIQQTVTLDELTSALHDPATHPAIIPYLEEALNQHMQDMFNGEEGNTIELNIPAMEVNIWSLDQLSQAIENPETDPELLIYLHHALNQLMTDIFAGNNVHEIAVITPPGVISTVPEPAVTPEEPKPPMPVFPLPVETPGPESPPMPIFPIPVETPGPEIPMPIFPLPVETPGPINPIPVFPVVEPEPVAPVVQSSPLVQIIVNVNAAQQAPSAPAPVITPEPVVVGPSPAIIDSLPEDQHILAIGPWA